MKTKSINSRKGFTLVEMLGVLAIIAILISVIAVGVMSAINRARIVATVANFKNLETAVVGFVALPNSGGTVPLTQSGTNPIMSWTGSTAVAVANTDNSYTLDQPLRASGLIDRPLSWRIGTDGMTQVNLANERIFMLSRNAWAGAGIAAVNGLTVGTGNNWGTFNHVECAPCDMTAVVGTPAAYLAPTGNGVNFYLDGVSPLRASRVAYVVLKNVSIKDAQKLSAELNGSLDDSETAGATDGQYRGRLVYAGPSAGVATVDVYYYLASF